MADFSALWERRTTVQLGPDEQIEVLSLPDLVRAKKTQQDKDWPMIRRLLEQAWFRDGQNSTPVQADFLLTELRTPELLIAACSRYRDRAARHNRPAVAAALRGDTEEVARLMREEEAIERQRDAAYWTPLRRELEIMRRTERLR
ncbi:MAG: hypothetical protein IT162_09285 [Bryobacterales bacterium]|nr:hypothetical protein [Bryobacterales bacterium]